MQKVRFSPLPHSLSNSFLTHCFLTLFEQIRFLCVIHRITGDSREKSFIFRLFFTNFTALLGCWTSTEFSTNVLTIVCKRFIRYKLNIMQRFRCNVRKNFTIYNAYDTRSLLAYTLFAPTYYKSPQAQPAVIFCLIILSAPYNPNFSFVKTLCFSCIQDNSLIYELICTKK